MELINQVGWHKRILVLSDTVEATPTFSLGKRIDEFGSMIKNAVFVVAGRPEGITRQEFLIIPEIYQDWKVHEIYHLKPFSPEETSAYLQQVLPIKIADDTRKKIILLTASNPVLISITGEWLKRHVTLPQDIDASLEELQALNAAELTERRKRFEFELIDRIRTLQYPIDWATLYLSYLDRRYDDRILRIALDIQDDAGLKVVKDSLADLVYVRKSMSVEGGLLHDEAKRLIRSHVWPVVDPDKALRRSLAQKVIDMFYLPEIERLDQIARSKLIYALERKELAPEQRTLPYIEEEWLKWDLLLECLDYHFRLSDDQGWAYMDLLIEEARSNRFSQMEAIQQSVYNNASQYVETPQFLLRRARIALARREIQEADRLAQEVLHASDITIRDKVSALDIRSDCTADPLEKRAYLEQAREQARAGNDSDLLARVYNSLGLVYRGLGQWQQAKQAYQEVLRLQKQTKQEHSRQYANTLNNLAYVYLQQGEVRRADDQAERALRIRKEHGDNRGLSLSYATKASIARATGSYDQALRYYQTAIELARDIGDMDNVALMQIRVSSSKRFAHNFDEARELIAAGLASNNRSLRVQALYEQAKIDREEAKALTARDATGQSPDSTSKYANAYKSAQEALAIARDLQDDHLTASILFELALITLFKDQREDEQAIRELRTILEDHDYIQEKGRLTELMGDLAYIRGDIIDAFKHYIQACGILADYTSSVFDQTFRRVRNKFFDISLELQRQVCVMVRKEYADIPPRSPLVALTTLCEDSDIFPEETIEPHLFQSPGK
jgi:tetratricopeptide (TPR) repeat protein